MKNFILLLAIIFSVGSCKNVGKSLSKGLINGTGEALGEATGKVIGQNIFDSLNQKQVSSQRYLLQIASEINKDLPIMVDKETMLTNVGAQNDTLVYNYILVNYLSAEVDKYTFIPTMNHNLTNSLCSNPDSKKILNKGVSLHYDYSGNDYKFIGKVIISSSDCR